MIQGPTSIMPANAIANTQAFIYSNVLQNTLTRLTAKQALDRLSPSFYSPETVQSLCESRYFQKMSHLTNERGEDQGHRQYVIFLPRLGFFSTKDKRSLPHVKAPSFSLVSATNKVAVRIPLVHQRGQWQPRKPSKRTCTDPRDASSVYSLPSTKEAIKQMHVVCGYPFKSTWLKAVTVGNYTRWSLLNEHNIKK